MKQLLVGRRLVAPFLSSALLAAACSAEPEAVIVNVDRQSNTPATTTEIRKDVRQGSLSAQGDATVARGGPSFGPCTKEDAAQLYPGQKWQGVYAPSVGWSEEKLDKAWQRARSGNYSAGMLVKGGLVLSRFGEVDQPYEAESIRKSMLNVVIGQLVAEGRLQLDSTLAELGVEEAPPLNDIERSATVEDLLMSRSGIYRDAAYSPPSQDDERPKPGQHRPGEHFYYNNWDFNALGTIVERATGKSVFELFRDRVAVPIGMQDFSLEDTRYVRDSNSVHPAYLVRLSTRDRARLGYLFLRNGCWNGRQVVSAAWVRKSVAPLTDRNDELDYGYLWWSQEAIESKGLKERVFMARGNPLQYIMVFPELDAVLVLTADRNYPGWVNWFRKRLGLTPEFEDYTETLSRVLSSRQ